MAVVGVGELLVVPSFKGLQREIGKEVAGASDSGPVKNAGSGIGKTLINGAKIGLAAGAAVLGTALTKGFGRLQAIENARAKLTGLGHEAGAVEGIMKNATDAVKGTAFGLGEAAGAAATLVAAGIKPGKDLEKQLTLVGDAATIAGVGFGDMSAIFSKAASSNKVQMDIIGQLHDMGVPALQLIADEMGVTAEEASKMASGGEVDFATFSKAMEKGMGGAAQESGKTLQGAFANSMAALGRFGANLMSGIYPQLTTFFAGFIEWMGPVEELAKVVGERLGQALSDFVSWLIQAGTWIKDNRAWIEPLVVAIGAAATVWALWTGAIKLWTVATKIATAVSKGFNAVLKANPIMKIIALVAALVAAIVWLYQNNETARKIIDAVWNGIKTGIKAAVDWIIGAWNNVKTWVTVTLPDAFNRLKSNIRGVWDNIWNKISSVWGSIKGVFNTIKSYLQNTLGPVFRWLKTEVIDPVWNGIKNAIKNVWNNGIKPVFDTIQKVLKGDFKGAFQTAKDAIDRIWKGVANVVRKPINFVINTVYNKGIVPVFNKVASMVGIGTLDTADDIPAFARGGFHKGGWALVGEEGPELVNFDKPGRVYTAAETQAMLAGQAQAPAGAFDGLNAAGLLNPSHSGIGGWLDGAFDGMKSVVNTVGGAIKKGMNWVRGGLAKAAEWVLKPILDSLGSNLGSEGFGGMAAGLARKAINGAISWLKGKDSEASADGGAMFFDGPLGKFAKPANGPITSGFGASRGRYPHAGIDFAVGIGSAVRSMLNGIVRKVDWNAVAGRSGKGMVVDHAQGYSSYYGHLSAWGKKPGDEVKAGERIASSGNTGRSTGPHLHAELWKNGRPFNYKSYLYDAGGVLPTGLSSIVNASGKPEAILSNSQWKSMSALASRGAAQFPDKMTLMVEGHEFTAYVSTVADRRLDARQHDMRRQQRQRFGAR